MLFVRAYPRESQEMVFDAHDRGFAFFKGACTRGIYDNMKTAVETIFVGKERAYNRRFLQMCSHYLVDPVACTPASGWEKGQVENQVGLVRERFFAPRLRVKNYDELNAWLMDQVISYAKAHRHPERRDVTIWEAFEAERPSLVPYVGRFDGFHALPARSAGPSRSAPMPTGSSCARTAASSASTLVPTAVIRRPSIPGIMCRCWPASRAPCAMAPPSRTGSFRPRWTGCAGSWRRRKMGTGRWSIS
jgi:hypothetical protein